MRPLLLRSALACALFAGSAASQTGVIDLLPLGALAGQRAEFAVSDPALPWQQQVRAGIAGELSGVRLALSGPVGARVTLRVRAGCGWSTGGAVFETELAKTSANAEAFFVDASSAHFPLSIGQRFVLELQGDGSGASVTAGYTPAAGGDPWSEEPLFLAGRPCTASTGWRIGFETFVDGGDITSFCSGRGCPCGNESGAGGCRNSTGSGAKLYPTFGGASVARDDLRLVVASLPRNVSGLVFFGSAQTRSPFGDGLQCAGGTTLRTAAGTSDANGAITLSRVASQSNGVATPGSAWIVQAWYRDPTGPCRRASNLSNALRVVFGP